MADEPSPEHKGHHLNWPKGFVPFPHVKKAPEIAHSGRNWRNAATSIGELAGISLISAGFGWYSPGLGLITGGLGLFAVCFVAAIPPSIGPDKR